MGEQPNSWIKVSGTHFSRLSRITEIIKWGVVKEGDILTAASCDYEAILLKNGHVMINEEETTIHSWLKNITGQSTVATYRLTRHKSTGKTLSQLRREYMENGGFIENER